MDIKYIFANKLKSAILDMFTIYDLSSIVQNCNHYGPKAWQVVLTFKVYGKEETFQYSSSILTDYDLREESIKEEVTLFARTYFDMAK